jgi:hypothetical protein
MYHTSYILIFLWSYLILIEISLHQNKHDKKILVISQRVIEISWINICSSTSVWKLAGITGLFTAYRSDLTDNLDNSPIGKSTKYPMKKYDVPIKHSKFTWKKTYIWFRLFKIIFPSAKEHGNWFAKPNLFQRPLSKRGVSKIHVVARMWDIRAITTTSWSISGMTMPSRPGTWSTWSTKTGRF